MGRIKKTKKAAIKAAEEELRNFFGVKRLYKKYVSTESCFECSCGQCQGVYVSAESKNAFETVSIGFCHTCGED